MQNREQLDRRRFLKSAAAGMGTAAVGGSLLNRAAAEDKAAKAPDVEVDPSKLIWRSKEPTMAYERLGRTNYMVSRVVAGNEGNDEIWYRMLQRGLNYFDTAWHYGGQKHEVELSRLFKRFRDKLWITSKASGIAGYHKIDDDVDRLYRKAMKDFLGESEGDLLVLHKKAVEKQKKTGEKPDLRPVGKHMANMYTERLHESLKKMTVDNVDSYFVHGVEIPWMFDCVELWEAYEKAHKEGKIRHFGFSCHKHHKEVLAAAVAANERGPWKIDLIMPGVNPESFDGLKPELEALRKQDVGIIAMKTSGIQNRPVDDREKKFNTLMGDKTFNNWERSKLWMLHMTEGLVDGVIAGMASNEQMEKDFELPMIKLSAEAERELRALVKLELSGSCSLCGNCETNCPENIAVADMIRYHAYVHQYDQKEVARQLYSLAGYDPAKICNSCGNCHDVCPTHVPVTKLLNELSIDMA